MTRYEITSLLSGVVLGVYDAADEAAALDLMAQDAGYVDYAHACDVAPVKEGEIIVTIWDDAAAKE